MIGCSFHRKDADAKHRILIRSNFRNASFCGMSYAVTREGYAVTRIRLEFFLYVGRSRAEARLAGDIATAAFVKLAQAMDAKGEGFFFKTFFILLSISGQLLRYVICLMIYERN
jgi:hypothetical protein